MLRNLRDQIQAQEMIFFLVESIDQAKSKETCHFLSPEQAHGMIDKNDSLDSC